ncbi:MAG: ribosome maturation factor RimM [Bacteroidia bacterium]
MKHEACFQIGTIIKKAGHDGKLNLQLDCDDPEQYINTESVFLDIHGKLVPFFVEQFRILNSQTAHLKLEDVDDAETSANLIGCDVFLPLELLPPLEGTSFYYHEVIGFAVKRKSDEGEIGRIASVFEHGMNDLFILDSPNGEILIPIAEDWIVEVNRDEKFILMDLPEGIEQVNSGGAEKDA